MPSLPSNVATYDTVTLLDLDRIELYFARGVEHLPRTAAKLNETERRWVMFDWLTFTVHQPRRNEALFRDFASAFLMSFEATLQVMREERAIPDFAAWLEARPAYDLICRGLRTLRHLEAHVQPGQFNPSHAAIAQSRFAHSVAGGIIGWRWEPLSLQDMAKVNSKIAAAELDEWNRRCEELLALGLMRHGVQSLHGLAMS